MEQQSTVSLSSSSPAGGSKKLTWSERQALAKKQQEEEEAKSRSAAFISPTTPVAKPVFKSSAPAFGRSAVSQSSPRNFGAGAAVGAVGATAAAFSAQSSPSPMRSSYTAAREAVREAAWGAEEEEIPPEPEPEYEAVSTLFVNSFATTHSYLASPAATATASTASSRSGA